MVVIEINVLDAGFPEALRQAPACRKPLLAPKRQDLLSGLKQLIRDDAPFRAPPSGWLHRRGQEEQRVAACRACPQLIHETLAKRCLDGVEVIELLLAAAGHRTVHVLVAAPRAPLRRSPAPAASWAGILHHANISAPSYHGQHRMLSRLCRIELPARFGPDPQRRGLLVDGLLVTWSQVRCVAYVTYVYHAGVDMDYMVVQTTGGTHYWVEVAGWEAGNWTPESTKAEHEWWVQALSGLPDPPQDLSRLGSVAILGVVQWPPAEVGRPMYEERSRRLLGLLPWGADLAPLLT